ncbi:hypothetical protein LCGC14_2162080 [marine sediment metagenome]|uniref:SCP2 domain-containing protein n=1 Tax=marine sediment metagenome TaxID=412755 RepID=A0A0F9G574_9ZZZZ
MNHRIDTPADQLGQFPDDVVARQVDRLVEAMNADSRFIEQLADVRATTLVLRATDTGREIMIVLDRHGVQARAHDGEPFDAMIEATEQVHVAVLTGQMDADAAFFARKVSIHGSLLAAFRVKNRFLSLLHWHWDHQEQPCE